MESPTESFKILFKNMKKRYLGGRLSMSSFPSLEEEKKCINFIIF